MGENPLIIHGILTGCEIFDSLIHEMNEINEFDVKRKLKKINWEKTTVYDNSNRGQKIAIFKERWT